MERVDGRMADELRPMELTLGTNAWAEGSCLFKMGNTHVLVTATVEEKVPPFWRGNGQGWISAEYGMLPRATQERTLREAVRGRQQGRTVEIQRLIGRALRAALDLKALGERSILLDCDVLQADGGTRAAAISAGFMAVLQALHRMGQKTTFATPPVRGWMAAVSVGWHMGEALLDLSYIEDSHIGVDLNLVMNHRHQISEIQGTAEHGLFSRSQLNQLLDLAELGVDRIIELQQQIFPEGAGLVASHG